MIEEKISVLFIEKEDSNLSSIKKLLEKNNFIVHIVFSIQRARDYISLYQPNIILLELEFDNMNGIEFCREIRNDNPTSKPYIIFYTNNDEHFVQISALNNGADDFISKSLSNYLLLSKLKSIKRRLLNPINLSTERMHIDSKNQLVYKNFNEINLPKKQFQLLNLFYKNPGKVFSRDEIKKQLWEKDENVKNRTIDVHIKKLRSLMGENCIRTIKGVGYKINLSALNL